MAQVCPLRPAPQAGTPPYLSLFFRTDCGYTPPTATTPWLVPRQPWLAVIDSEAKCGSEVPSDSEARVAPVAGLSSYRVPALQSVTQTAPPPTTGEPHALAGPRHSTRSLSPAVLIAAIPPCSHGSYTVLPWTAAAP